MLRSLFPRSSLFLGVAAALALPLILACSSTPATGGNGGTGGTGGQGTGGAPIDAGMDAPALSDGGMDAPPDAPADSGACKLASPYSSKNAVCNACAEEKCCPEINGCLLDTGCNDDYVNCTLVCAFTDFDAGADAGSDAGAEGCLADCGQQFPEGKAEYDVAIGCAESACATECQ